MTDEKMTHQEEVEQLERKRKRLENERLEHRFSVMADLENDIAIRKREKIIVASITAGLSIFLLLLAFIVKPTASKERAFTSNASSGILARNSSSAKVVSGNAASSSEPRQASSEPRQASSESRKASSELRKASSETRTSSAASEGLGTPANFKVRVSVSDLAIRSEPSKSSKQLGVCPPGVYTIARVYKGDNYTWGQLNSGQGWIALDFTEGVDGAIPQIATKIDIKNLTAEQVEKWVTYTINQGKIGLIKDIKVEKRSDNLVYVDVSLVFDGGVFHNYYRISSQGYLEFDMNGSWQVVDREYHE